jgi:hypothetical protein
MWHCPISGSQINGPAKLFKQFTPTETLTLDRPISAGGWFEREIRQENNYYRACASIAWVDATERGQSDEQPISGLTAHTGYMTIKYNGTYQPQLNDPKEPEHGDILEIDGERWIIEDGVQRVRNKSLINFAVVYLPLRKLL